MARLFTTLGIWIAVVTISVMMVLANEPEEVISSSSRKTSTIVGSSTPTSNSGKRRLGGVIKYKKVSVKLPSPDTSGGETVVSFVQGGNSNRVNKTRRIKLKTSPQTMVYKPSKETNNKINSAYMADDDLPIIATIRPEIIEELSSSTAVSTTTTLSPTSKTTESPRTHRIPFTSTTESPRTHRIPFTSTTEEPEAFSPFVGFIRPTARVRVIKRPVNREPKEEDNRKPATKYPVRTVTRVRVPSTSTTTRRPSVKSLLQTTTRTTTTERPSSTTPQFIRPTRRPTRKRINQNRLEKFRIPYVTTTESVILLEDIIEEPESARHPEEVTDPFQGEHFIRNGGQHQQEDTQQAQFHSSSSVPFRRTTTTTVTPIRLTTPEPSVFSEGELSYPRGVLEEYETASNRLQKYEEVKAKQLENLRHNRPVVRRPSVQTEAGPNSARIVPSNPVEENFADLVDYVRPPHSNYGLRLSEFPKKESLNILNDQRAPSFPAEESDERLKVIYTPPVYEYQPPAEHLTGGYLPRIRVSGDRHQEKVLIPSVTYEPPHKEYEAPSPPPPPPPLRIYEPPTEDYRPPAHLLYHDGYRRNPEEDLQPESYARLVAVGSPTVNELPYPPALDESSYPASVSEPKGPFRPSPENESQKDENDFQPAVYVSYDPVFSSERPSEPQISDKRPYVTSTQTPNTIEEEKPYVLRLKSKPEKPTPLVNQRVPFEPVETYRPVHQQRVRVIQRPSDQDRRIPNAAAYENQVNTNSALRVKFRPEPTEEPNRVIIRHKEAPSIKLIDHDQQHNINTPSRNTVTNPPSYNSYVTVESYEPRHREPSTYRPHVVIEKPITLTNYRELSGPFYTTSHQTYAARPYHQGGINRAPSSPTGIHQLSPVPIESTFNNQETIPESSWSVNPINLRPFQITQQQRPKLETPYSVQYRYLRQNRSLEGPAAFDSHHNNHSPSNDYHQIDGAVRGTPGLDFPILKSIPENLKFDCGIQESPGYYADLDTRCQVFHVCQTNRDKDSFLCPNGTIFNQKVRVCDWWHNVKCGESEAFYYINSDLGDQLHQSSNYENPG